MKNRTKSKCIQTGDKNSSRKKRRGCVSVLLGLSALLLFIFTLTVLALMGIIFDPPKTYKLDSLRSENFRDQSQIIGRLLPTIMQSRPGEQAELVLSPSEVNSILLFIGQAANVAAIFTGKDLSTDVINKPYQVVYKNGRFHIEIAADTGFNNPFGRYIVLKFSGRPVIDEKGAFARLDSARAGMLPVPTGQAEAILKAILDKYRGGDVYKTIRGIIIKAYVDGDNNLVIVYHPYQLRKYVFDNFFSQFE